jgi:hypothetical protein
MPKIVIVILIYHRLKPLLVDLIRIQYIHDVIIFYAKCPPVKIHGVSHLTVAELISKLRSVVTSLS